MRRNFLAAIALFCGVSSYAGGFQLNTQSVRAMGIGGANTAWVFDPSINFYNPAGLTRLSGLQFYGGVHYIIPSVSLQTAVYDNIDQTTPNANPIHFYASYRVNDKIGIGFGVNNQFGSTSSFEDDWQGRYIIQNISLTTFMFQPSIAYQIHEKISLGAGFVLTSGAFNTQKAIPLSSSDNLYGQATLEGSGKAFGGNFGILVDVFENEKFDVSWGADYRTSLAVDLPEGTARFTDIPNSLRETFPESTSFSGGLTLPMVTTSGVKIGYQLNEDVQLTALYDFNYTGWSSYDTLSFDFAHEGTPDSETPKNWQNTVTHRIGLDICIKEKFSVRGGIYIDKTPIPDGFVSPELPDADITGFTSGLSFQASESINIDASFLYQYAERTASLDIAEFEASYRRKALVFGLGVQIKLNGKKEGAAIAPEETPSL